MHSLSRPTHNARLDLLGDVRWWSDDLGVRHMYERCCSQVWVYCWGCDAKACLRCFVEGEGGFCTECRDQHGWRRLGGHADLTLLLRQVRAQAALTPDQCTNCADVIRDATSLLAVLATTTTTTASPELRLAVGNVVHNLSFELYDGDVQ